MILNFTHCCSKWIQRRVVITKSVLAFALVGDDKMIDLIPLAEVESCKPYEIDEHLRESRGSEEHLHSAALQIETMQDGYNSGRSDYQVFIA